MTEAERLAAFVVRTAYEYLSEEAQRELKARMLDALGCAIGALEGPPMGMLRAQLEDLGGRPLVKEGYSRQRSVPYATLSGLVEPAAGLLGVSLVIIFAPLLPPGPRFCHRRHAVCCGG